MPRGTAGIVAAKRDIEERKASGGGGGLWFRLRSGEEATVRFLEQGDDLAFAWCHEMPKEPNERYPRLVVCRDQGNEGTPCPGCEQQFKRRFRGWINIIWRDAPVRKQDKEGKWIRTKDGKEWEIEGHADQTSIWNAGIEVFDNLVALDAHYKGLMSRDFTVKRSGEGLDTKWTPMPEEPSELSEADKKLAESKPDLDRYITPQSYENWGSRERQSTDDAPSGGSEGSEKPANPFKSSRKNPFKKE